MIRSLKAKTCCFTGHRHLPPNSISSIQAGIRQTVTDLVSRGVIYYGVGGAIGFDTLAAETLFGMREEYTQIRVILVYPFDGFESRWTDEQQKKYRGLLPLYDKIVCISNIPCREAYLERNRHLVDHSTYCVSYCSRDYGGTAYTARYAKEKGCVVYNIFPTAI